MLITSDLLRTQMLHEKKDSFPLKAISQIFIWWKLMFDGPMTHKKKRNDWTFDDTKIMICFITVGSSYPKGFRS